MKSSITSPPLPETNSSPLKIDSWKIKPSFWDAIVSGAMLVSGRVLFHETQYQRRNFCSESSAAELDPFSNSKWICSRPQPIKPVKQCHKTKWQKVTIDNTQKHHQKKHLPSLDLFFVIDFKKTLFLHQQNINQKNNVFFQPKKNTWRHGVVFNRWSSFGSSVVGFLHRMSSSEVGYSKMKL